MRNFYISKNYKTINSAGNKAKTDIEKCLADIGLRNIGFTQSHKSNLALDYFYTLGSVLKGVIKISKGDMIVLQYPWKKYYTWICKQAHRKGAKTITIIHDLGSFRRQKLTVDQEIARLNLSDVIIAHNQSMANWLKEQGLSRPIICLEIFDYLSTVKPSDQYPSVEIYRVAYAGALSPKKNQFLYDLFRADRPYIMELFGNGFEQDDKGFKTEINYHGFTPSDRLIETINAHFGLVWDGESIEECSGTYGLYLRYNNPHKTSLYLRSHIPVIVWSESALAPFVRENRVGICVESLNDLPGILNNLTPENYQEMKNNAIKVGTQIGSGYYIQTAFNKALELL